MIIRKPVISFIALCLIMALSACTFDIGSPNADKRITSAIKLKATKDIFIATATSAKRLCEQGILSEDDCETAEIAYMEGKDVLIAAKEVWDGMLTIDSFDNTDKYDELIILTVKFTTIIETIIRKVD